MRVCVVGTGPWPLEERAVVTGPSIRLRQFVEPLLAARHEVVVVLLEDQPRRSVPIAGTLAAASFAPEQILDPVAITHVVDMSHVGAVFGVGSLMPAAAAARLASHLKAACWIDHFGDPMAELHAAQLRQGGEPDLAARDHVWKFVRETLLRGDAFSSVSAAQRYAMMGQLGLLGRFGNQWDVSRRLHEIPCAVPTQWTTAVERPPFPEALKQRGLDETDRYVYFGGSWNVWLDEVAMGKALAIALRDEPALRFVCCGIPTGRAGETIKQSMINEIAEFKDRIIDLEPQPPGVESAILAHAGACLSLDRPIPEAELGSRNRLLAMVRWGARPVVSLEAGVESLLVAEGLAAGVHDANTQRAALEILNACQRSASQREEDRQHGLRWLRTMTFEETMRPVLEWIRSEAPRWEGLAKGGLLDRWAVIPAEPSILFGDATAGKRRKWPF